MIWALMFLLLALFRLLMVIFAKTYSEGFCIWHDNKCQPERTIVQALASVDDWITALHTAFTDLWTTFDSRPYLSTALFLARVMTTVDATSLDVIKSILDWIVDKSGIACLRNLGLFVSDGPFVISGFVRFETDNLTS